MMIILLVTIIFNELNKICFSFVGIILMMRAIIPVNLTKSIEFYVKLTK